MENRQYYEELKKEIEYLTEVKRIIETFFNLLTSNKNTIFLNLDKYKIQNLLNIVIDFLNKNNVKMWKLQKENSSIDIFVNMIVYFSKRRHIWSLKSFEEYVMNYINKLKTNNKDDIFAFVWLDIFWTKIMQDVFIFIDNEIEILKQEMNIIEKDKNINFSDNLYWLFKNQN